MVSYETVKYFNAEYYEFNRYREAIRDFQKSEYTVTLALQVMNISQTLIFMLGLTIVCFIAAYQVSTDKIKVGKFVSLLTYMVQLQSPLTFFGTFYRVIQSSMIAAERLLELFKEQPTVVDKRIQGCSVRLRLPKSCTQGDELPLPPRNNYGTCWRVGRRQVYGLPPALPVLQCASR
jgi:ABC-type transport system involved in Fe-S cluster assembly fused permease/ATPase subunit